KDGGSTDHTTDVVVNNVAPTASAGTDLVAYAGTPLNFTGTDSDPGNDVVSRSWVAVSGNTLDAILGSGSTFSFTPDREGSCPVLFKATDWAGATGTAVVQVTVLHVTPTGTASNDGPVDEGSTATVSVTITNATPAEAQQLHYAYDFDNVGPFEIGDGTYA